MKLPVLILPLCFASAEGYRATYMKQRLQASTALSSFQHLTADTEEDAMYFLAKAQECALSDSGTVQQAKLFLREIVHLQSSCVIGTLAGRQVCENQAQVAEIVQHLRDKIEAQENAPESVRGVIAVGENGEAFLRNSLSLPFAIIGFTAIFAALVNS